MLSSLDATEVSSRKFQWCKDNRVGEMYILFSIAILIQHEYWRRTLSLLIFKIRYDTFQSLVLLDPSFLKANCPDDMGEWCHQGS